MRIPDFEAWAMFAAVADHASFTRAAEALGVSKATVSKAVTRLEQALDTSLFNRTSRRLSLTPAGTRLADHARRIVEEGAAAEEAARSEIEELSGTIRLAAPMTFGLNHVSPLVAEFLVAHPGVQIDLHLSDARIDIVEMGFDATIRIAALPDSSLRARRLKDVRGHIVASPAYLDRMGRPDHPSALTRHACLSYAYTSTPDSWRLNGPDGEHFSFQPHGPLRTTSGDSMLDALRAGLGVAVLPDFIVERDLCAGRLEAILPQWSFEAVGVYLVTPPSRLRPARVEALLDFLARRLSE